MKIGITGASGFIGSHLTKFLAAQGHNLRTFGRKDLDPSRFKPEDLNELDHLIHLAGESIASGRWNTETKEKILRSRVDSTRLLVDAMKVIPLKPKSFLCSSAIGFYGNRGDEILREDSSSGTGFLTEVCVAWEKEAMRLRGSGVRTVILRNGMVLSPDGGALQKIIKPFQIGLGSVMGSGNQWMSWISIHDLNNAILHCLTNDTIEGPVNMVSPKPVKNLDFTEILARVLHRTKGPRIPEFALKLMMGEMAQELILSSTRVTPEILLKSQFDFSQPELESALRELINEHKES